MKTPTILKRKWFRITGITLAALILVIAVIGIFNAGRSIGFIKWLRFLMKKT